MVVYKKKQRLLWQRSFSLLSVSAWHALARKKKATIKNVIPNATAEAEITTIANAANLHAIASPVRRQSFNQNFWNHFRRQSQIKEYDLQKSDVTDLNARVNALSANTNIAPVGRKPAVYKALTEDHFKSPREIRDADSKRPLGHGCQNQALVQFMSLFFANGITEFRKNLRCRQKPMFQVACEKLNT